MSLMITFSFVLSTFILFKMPFGGSVTLGSTCPIIIFSLRHGTKISFLCGLTYGLIKIILSFHAPPVRDFLSFLLVILFDYLVPYSCLSFASIFYKKFKQHKAVFSCILVLTMRYIFSILSGIIIWNSLVPENFNVFWYSFLYNSVYMIPEIVITTALCTLLYNNKNFTL